MAKDKDFRIGYFKENQKQYDFYKRLVKSEYIYEDELGNIEYADDPLKVLWTLRGECNACQQYVIDTYKVVGESLVVIDSRDPNWGAWERYKK